MNDDDFKRLIDASAAETRRHFEETWKRIEKKVDAVDQKFESIDKRFDAVDQKFDAVDKKLNESVVEMQRHLGVAVEHFDKKFQAIAELVTLVDEKLDRETKDIRKEMRQGFADTQAMIKFSHSELSTRISTLEAGHRTLEEAVVDLTARMERLEGSTH